MRLQSNIELTENSWFYTSAKSKDGSGRLLDVAGDETIVSSGSTREALKKAAADAFVGVQIPSGGNALLDDLVVKAWPGRHALAQSTLEPTLESGYLRTTSKVVDATLQASEFTGYNSWTAHAVVKRTVSSWVGDAVIARFFSSSGADHQIRFLLRANGSLQVDGRVNGSAFSGRATATGLFNNDETHIVTFASVAGQSWRIYLDGTRVDSANVTSGVGIGMNQFTSWSPAFRLGGHAYSPDILRVQFRGGQSYLEDENSILRDVLKLNWEHGIFTREE